MKSGSLLRRLILWYGVSFILLSLASTTFLYFKLRQGLESQSNLILVERIDAARALLQPGALTELRTRVEKEWPSRGGKRLYIRVERNENGHFQTITQTPNLPQFLGPVFDSMPSQAPFHRFESPEGEPYLAKSFVEGSNRIEVAIDQAQAKEFLAAYRETAIGVLLLTILASVAIGWQIARESLRPIRAIARTVSRISSRNLSERLDLNQLPDELHSLARAFNVSLDRLQESFDRLSRFSADIAHELRTPLSIMRGEIEVSLGRGRDPEEYHEALSSTLEECNRLTSLIERLLFLARADFQPEKIHREKVELRSELEAMIEYFEASVQEAELELRLEYRAREGAQILAERALFQRVMINLIANAIRYSPRGGEIWIRCEEVSPDRTAPPSLKIQVEDEGPGIPTEHLTRIFDRFYRVDPSRNPESGGFGLGLAIVKSIVQLHGGEVYAESASVKGTRVVLVWPAA